MALFPGTADATLRCTAAMRVEVRTVNDRRSKHGDVAIRFGLGISTGPLMLGAIGGGYSTPIINVPEVAILLLGRSRKMPAVREDRVEIRFMMPLSLSYDHRLVDGGAAARFLNDVIDYLQSPSRLVLAP